LINQRRERRKFEEALKKGRRIPRGFRIEVSWNNQPSKSFSLRDLQIPEEGGSKWSEFFRIPR
jgi:hypothetical protein